MVQLADSEAPASASRRALLLLNSIVTEKRGMMIASCRNANRIRRAILALAGVSAMAVACAHLWADEPYARNRDYDWQHSKIARRFDLDQKKVIGDVTHMHAFLRAGTATIAIAS